MRIVAVVVAAALLSAPVAIPAMAGNQPALQGTATDISAAKKPLKKKKKAKVEYMKAAPVK